MSCYVMLNYCSSQLTDHISINCYGFVLLWSVSLNSWLNDFPITKIYRNLNVIALLQIKIIFIISFTWNRNIHLYTIVLISHLHIFIAHYKIASKILQIFFRFIRQWTCNHPPIKLNCCYDLHLWSSLTRYTDGTVSLYTDYKAPNYFLKIYFTKKNSLLSTKMGTLFFVNICLRKIMIVTQTVIIVVQEYFIFFFKMCKIVEFIQKQRQRRMERRLSRQ